MATDFSISDFYTGSLTPMADGGGVYPDFGFSEPASVYAPIDFAPEFEFQEFSFEPTFESFLIDEPPIEEIAPGEFDFGPLVPPTLEPFPELIDTSGSETYQSYFDFYTSMGVDPVEASEIAAQAAEALTGAIIIPDVAPLPEEPVALPAPLSPILPFIPFTPGPEQFLELPFIPFEEPVSPPPPVKLGPCSTPNGLPGVCAQGFYHPMADPCACVPFPPAPTSSQTPRPPVPTQTPAPAPRPQIPQQQQQQACPTTHCKHTQTGQCMLIPVGYQRHPQTQVCTPITAPASQLPPSVSGALDQLKKVPWWVWAAGAGLLLLSQGGGGDRTTTVRYRRS